MRAARAPRTTSTLDRDAELRRIYALAEAALPERFCRRSTRCCRFAETGREPHVTAAEIDHALAAYAASGRRTPAPRSDGVCPFLAADGSSCSIYEARPFGCRTHFCDDAGGAVPRRSLAASLAALAALDEALGGDGPRPLSLALDRARRPRRTRT